MATILWGYVPIVPTRRRTRAKPAVVRRSVERGPDGTDTRARLIEAGGEEFNTHGFHGTDTNKIARRAGFAPQTFYRWFKDKAEIFIAVYRTWEDEEWLLLHRLLERNASSTHLVDAIVGHHRKHLVFRRSLRRLAVEDPVVRSARTESRRRQIAWIGEWVRDPAIDTGAIAATLLQMERLADALAEGELEDLELPSASAEQALAGIIQGLLDRRRNDG